MPRKILRESRTDYTVASKSNATLDQPVIIKRNGKRVALVPLAEYKQFVAWKQKQHTAQAKTARRTRLLRKRKKGDLMRLAGFFKSEPGQPKIDFSQFMNKHGYEQIDRDDS